ncbi:MAG: OmpA family protein [Nitrospirota bacterium]|nr:OmpA family protein [Nitrospirota bacterium]
MLIVIFSLFFITNICYAAQSPRGEGRELKERIALFPLVNLSEDRDALRYVMPVLRTRLEDKGFDVVDEDSLNRFLLKERVRATGYISKDMARKIGKELNVKAVLLGSVNLFLRGENPGIGLSARLVDSSTGLILWADYASATGDDFTKILGLGRIKTMDKLLPRVADRLLASFTTMPSRKETEHTYRIAVMPFRNNSGVRDAGIIATYMFLVELFKNPVFEPVEFGEVRRAVVDLRVRERGELDYRYVKALSKSLWVDGFLVGTVELYSDGLNTASPPEVSIAARIVDAGKNRLLWCDSSQLRGDDNIIVLDWGRIRSVDKVAFRVVSKLVKRAEKVCGGPVPVVSEPPPKTKKVVPEIPLPANLQKGSETYRGPEIDQRSPPITREFRTTIYFDYRSAEIGKDAYSILLGFIDFLNAREITGITIEGHSCAHGPKRFNYEISRRRALAVRNFLIKHGDVAEDRIIIKYFGEDGLLYPEIPTKENINDPEVKKNRRVLVTVTYRR